MNKTHKKRLEAYKKKINAKTSATKFVATDPQKIMINDISGTLSELDVSELMKVLKSLPTEKLQVMTKGIRLVAYSRGVSL